MLLQHRHICVLQIVIIVIIIIIIRLSSGVRTPPCAIACINICAHVKDPVDHVRVRWITETQKHPACTVGWVARLRRSWLSPGKSNPNFPWEKSHWNNTVVNKGLDADTQHNTSSQLTYIARRETTNAPSTDGRSEKSVWCRSQGTFCSQTHVR